LADKKGTIKKLNIPFRCYCCTRYKYYDG